MDAAGRGSPSALIDYYSGNRANNTVDADESTRSARTVSAALARRKGGFFGPLGGLRVGWCHSSAVLKSLTRTLDALQPLKTGSGTACTLFEVL